MSSNLPIIAIELVLVLGGTLAFGWWQLRDVKRAQAKRAAERAAEKAEDPGAEVGADSAAAAGPAAHESPRS